MAAGNPPEVIEQARRTHAAFVKFREWLAERDKAAAGAEGAGSTPQSRRTTSEQFPTFKEWLAQSGSRPAEQP